MPTEQGEMSIKDVEKLYEINADIKYIRMMLEQSLKNYDSLDKTVNGNGKPGLKQEIHDIQKWHEDNDADLKRVIQLNSNQSYIKKGTWEIVRWLGSGTVIYGFLHLLK